MYRCPVCQKENTSIQCGCGFDLSRDYEGYPTLAPIKAGSPSRRGKSRTPSTLYRCKNCGGGIFYLHPDEGICVCFKCGLDTPIPGKPKAAAPVPAAPPKKTDTGKIITYDAYLKALEQKFLDNGKRPLSQSQIDGFIREHQLDKRFDIRTGEVRRDLETIYAKHKPQTSSNQVNTYDSYMKALENLYLQNGKKALSASQIREFLDINSLGKKFGITDADVQRDLKTIEEKYTQYGNLSNILRQKSVRDTSSLSSILSQLGKKK